MRQYLKLEIMKAFSYVKKCLNSLGRERNIFFEQEKLTEILGIQINNGKTNK